MTLLEAIAEHARQTPQATAIAGRRSIGYAQLWRRVSAGAAGLRAAGMRPGDRVLFAVRPGPTAVVTALSVIGARGVLVVADPGAGAALAQVRRGLVRPRWSIASPLVHLMTRPAAQRFLSPIGLSLPDLEGPGLRHIVVGAGPMRLAGRGPAVLSWSDVVAAGADLSAPDPDPELEALIVFTSGTTQAPRAVRHTLASVSAGAEALLQRLRLTPDDIVHTDQLMIALPTLAAGATWSPAPVGADGARWRRTATRARASVGYAVPTTLHAATRAGPLPGCLRLLATGGAPVTPAVVGGLRAAAPLARVIGVYGLTEALPVATVEAEDLLAHAENLGAGVLLGDPVAHTQVGVDDEGQLWVQGPQVGGYLDSTPGRVLTGDLVRVLPGGRLELLGRAKDMILRGVTNIYPALVEPVVEAEPQVAQAAMIGVPHPVTGDERVVLAVVPAGSTRPGSAESVEPDVLVADLRRRLPQLLDAAWLPDEIVVLDSLPRSGRAGKVDKQALRRVLADPVPQARARTRGRR